MPNVDKKDNKNETLNILYGFIVIISIKAIIILTYLLTFILLFFSIIASKLIIHALITDIESADITVNITNIITSSNKTNFEFLFFSSISIKNNKYVICIPDTAST